MPSPSHHKSNVDSNHPPMAGLLLGLLHTYIYMRYILLIKSGYIIQVIIGNEGMDQVTYFFPILFVMKIHVHPILVSEGYQGCDSQPYISNQ